jgi:hypothetical protein
MSQKFVGGTRENLSIFADQTIAMLSEEDAGFSLTETLYIREYIDVNGEEEKIFMAHRNDANLFFRRIIRYSLHLVTIAETNDTEEGRVEAYSKFLSSSDQELFNKIDFEDGYAEKLISDVSSKETFLEALRAAQPMINGTGKWMMGVLDDLNSAAEEIVNNVDNLIEVEFAEVIAYQEALEDEKYAILRSFGKIYRIYRGDTKAFEELIDLNTIRKKALIPDSFPTEEELNKLAEHLLKRLEGLHKIGEEIRPDWEAYRATRRELDKLHMTTLNRINRARVITLVWLRAHQKMASGLSTPAEWFDINTLPAELFKLGAKAAFK